MTVKIMRSLDHSMIYILIAGTITPICILAMDGWTRWLLLSAVWAGALFGATLTAVHGHRYPRLGFALYLILGWATIGTFPGVHRPADSIRTRRQRRSALHRRVRSCSRYIDRSRTGACSVTTRSGICSASWPALCCSP